jgi:hypothetical protein
VTAAETVRPDGPPSGTWLDEGQVSPQWAPPAGDPVRRPRVPGALVYGGVVLVLVLLLAAVWGAGGFKQRTDLIRPVQPGALISTGPFELSFTEATAQQLLDSKGVVTEWEIVVIGQARTTGDVSIAPTYFGADGIFTIQDLAANITATPKSATIGDDTPTFGSNERSLLAPGLPATGYRLKVTLPASYQPGPTIRLLVADQVYRAKYLTTDEEAWDDQASGTGLHLPLRVVPPKT